MKHLCTDLILYANKSQLLERIKWNLDLTKFRGTREIGLLYTLECLLY